MNTENEPLTEQELLEQQQLEALKKARIYENNRHLRNLYQSRLTDESLTAIERRYYSDMLTLVNDPSQKTEINKFWNHVQLRRDIYDNKIEYLHEVIEYLRELVVQVGDPNLSLHVRNNIVRKAANKEFLNDPEFKSLIKNRIKNNY